MLGSLLALALAVTPPPAAIPVRGPAVVMLWAPWCAPCREEVRSYPALSAASPVPVHVVALDTAPERRSLLRSIPRDRLVFEARPSVVVLPRWSPDTGGLPTTLGVGADGQVCGRVEKALTVERLAGLIGQCGFVR